MRILMLVPYYAPDLGPSAPLFTMLAIGLTQRGHQVTVIAAVPHYPSGHVPEAFRGRWMQPSQEQGVQVIRVALPSVERASLGQRLLQFMSYQVGATVAGLGQEYDVVLSANPALWVWLPFACHVVLRRKPAVFSVHDVYPDVGVTLGVFQHRAVVVAVGGLERFCLDRAAAVRVLSESFRPGLRALGVPDAKMTLIYDWVDTDLIQPLPRDNAFAQENDLADRFVVLYAGNVGLSQGLEQVLDAAEALAANDDVRFVFVGEGAARARLEETARARRLVNVRFLPFQPRGRLPEVLASADVSLVTLRKGIGFESLPSKCFSILASGRPMIASVDRDSETCRLVELSEAGLCVPPESPPHLVEAVLALKGDERLRRRLGHNGRTWAERYHSPQSAALAFERLLERAMAPQCRP